VPHERASADEAAEEDRVGTARGDDALRAGARPLDQATAGQVGLRDRGRRVAEIEPGDLPTVYLAHHEGVGPSSLQRERVVDAAHQHDLARPPRERVRRRAEGTEDVNDDCEPAS